MTLGARLKKNPKHHQKFDGQVLKEQLRVYWDWRKLWMGNWEQTELGLSDTPRKFWLHSVQTTRRNQTEFQACSENSLSLESFWGDLWQDVLQISLGNGQGLGTNLCAQGGPLWAEKRWGELWGNSLTISAFIFWIKHLLQSWICSTPSPQVKF